MLQDFAIRVQNVKTEQIHIITVSAIDYDMALSIVSDYAASEPDLAVLGF